MMHDISGCLNHGQRFLTLIMTAGTGIILMAIVAFQAIHMGMIAMKKCDIGAFLGGGGVCLLDRFAAWEVVFGFVCHPLLSFVRLHGMADLALGLIAPFPVASHALSMVGAFQPRLSDVFMGKFGIMTFFAGWMEALGRGIVMAAVTTTTHVSHFRVNLVVELYRLIEIFYVIQYDLFRTGIRGQDGACLVP